MSLYQSSCSCGAHNHQGQQQPFCSCHVRESNFTNRNNHSFTGNNTDRFRNHSRSNMHHSSRTPRTNQSNRPRMTPLSKRRDCIHKPLPSLCPKDKLISDLTNNSINEKSKDNDSGNKNIVIIF